MPARPLPEPPRPPLRKRVRCLGVHSREHFFWSTGPGNRVCAKCRDRLRQANPSPVCERPAPYHGEALL